MGEYGHSRLNSSTCVHARSKNAILAISTGILTSLYTFGTNVLVELFVEKGSPATDDTLADGRHAALERDFVRADAVSVTGCC